ncbi:MAG: aldo/keto reductase [Oscillospiraceae bacterium]|jgi:hypothetical protein|nr:aldo/keto reductase [Oscillospiraceae bacterium]
MMQTRYMPNTDATVSLLGFGAMRLPTDAQGNIDYPQAQAMVQLAYENGVNYYDTAYMYHGGKSEGFYGDTLTKYPRDSYYLASKFPVGWCEKEEDIDRIFNEQLARCKTEYFDFYLLHALDKEKFQRVKDFKIYERMLQYKAEGKIRRLGFSFHDTPDVLDAITDAFQFDFVQIQFNYLDWVQQDAERSYKILESKNLPIVVMEPVRGGYLHRLPEKIASVFKAIDPEASNASWALRWVADHPQVKVILSGMSSMEQVQDNLNVLGQAKPLSPEENKAVETVREMIRSQKNVPCTACEYCMSECPNGIKIPGIFKLYNDYTQSLNVGKFRREYREIPEESRADKCISCGACVAKCPQHIEIFTELAEIDKLLHTL